uniref:Uncharacterized protein n=1 Tax=Strigamia maritima TaxID=126957 RepID=T1IGQ8_STRMM
MPKRRENLLDTEVISVRHRSFQNGVLVSDELYTAEGCPPKKMKQSDLTDWIAGKKKTLSEGIQIVTKQDVDNEIQDNISNEVQEVVNNLIQEVLKLLKFYKIQGLQNSAPESFHVKFWAAALQLVKALLLRAPPPFVVGILNEIKNLLLNFNYRNILSTRNWLTISLNTAALLKGLTFQEPMMYTNVYYHHTGLQNSAPESFHVKFWAAALQLVKALLLRAPPPFVVGMPTTTTSAKALPYNSFMQLYKCIHYRFAMFIRIIGSWKIDGAKDKGGEIGSLEEKKNYMNSKMANFLDSSPPWWNP